MLERTVAISKEVLEQITFVLAYPTVVGIKRSGWLESFKIKRCSLLSYCLVINIFSWRGGRDPRVLWVLLHALKTGRVRFTFTGATFALLSVGNGRHPNSPGEIRTSDISLEAGHNKGIYWDKSVTECEWLRNSVKQWGKWPQEWVRRRAGWRTVHATCCA
jgi:hypothetical protein